MKTRRRTGLYGVIVLSIGIAALVIAALRQDGQEFLIGAVLSSVGIALMLIKFLFDSLND